MVAWWPLDETGGTALSDHSALGLNPGTASGPIGSGGSSPKSFTGFVGNGLNFVFGNRVTVQPSPSLDFGTIKSFTIDAWIKGNASPIVSNYDISTKTGYSVVFDGAKLRLEMGTGGIPSIMWYGPAITPDVWTFVAVVVNRAAQTVTLYTAAPGSSLATSGPLAIPANANAGINLPFDIGGCPGNPNGCTTIIDEVEIFNRALTQAELQSIVDAGNAGKCMPKGMTWQVGAVNTTNGTITVGCGSTGANPCNPTLGDQLCTASLPLLCIFKPAPSGFPKPASVNNTNIYNRWSGGIVGATSPVAASSFLGSLASANAKCVQEFGTGWRVAEFHDGWGWNFQAYGNVGTPSSQFWVHINGQPNGRCWN
jgi:hypothetical protein